MHTDTPRSAVQVLLQRHVFRVQCPRNFDEWKLELMHVACDLDGRLFWNGYTQARFEYIRIYTAKSSPPGKIHERII